MADFYRDRDWDASASTSSATAAGSDSAGRSARPVYERSREGASAANAATTTTTTSVGGRSRVGSEAPAAATDRRDSGATTDRSVRRMTHIEPELELEGLGWQPSDDAVAASDAGRGGLSGAGDVLRGGGGALGGTAQHASARYGVDPRLGPGVTAGALGPAGAGTM